jgi:membrane protein YdbS with pleckstrin-like domain
VNLDAPPPHGSAKPLALRVHQGDATVWVWICYGLVQATITMLMAFDVIQTITPAEIVTAVTLVIYVAVNELIVRPRRRRWTTAQGDESDA